MRHLPIKDSDDDQPGERRRGNVGIYVGMASLAFTFLIQFGGSIWWGATLSADVRHVNEQLNRMDGERYTKTDAARDILRVDQHDMATNEQVNQLRERVERIEARDLGSINRRRN